VNHIGVFRGLTTVACWTVVAAFLAAFPAPGASGVFNVRDFGARGDGTALDTAAINMAIEACSAAGGGQVLIPPGNYLSGSVILKSNVHLRLEAGSRIVGTRDLAQYKYFSPPAGTFEARNPRWHSALVLIEGAENVSISGPGVVDGNNVRDPKGEERMRGPHALVAGNSKRILIRDVQFMDAGNYHMLMEWCDDIEILSVTARGAWDGVHLRWTKNVVIANSQFYTGDDAIAGRYWENVLIMNCVLNSSCNGVRVIGPARRLIIQGCLIYGPGLYPHITSGRNNLLAGIYLQPGSWDPSSGDLDDIFLSDITMRNPATPFRLMMHKGNQGGEIVLNRISASGVYRGGISLVSADAAIRRVVLRDVNIEYSRDDKSLKAEHQPLSAWGLVARNLKGLLLENVRLSAAEPLGRPAMIVDDVEKVILRNVRTDPFQGDEGAVAFNRVEAEEVREAEGLLVTPRCTSIVAAGDGASDVASGKPFRVQVRAVNRGQAGLGRVELLLGTQRYTRWLWFSRGEAKTVVFGGLQFVGDGPLHASCGSAQTKLSLSR
jgi:hypothetical protein